MPETIRSRIVDALGDRVGEVFARRNGFPSAAALEDSLRLCIRLRDGGQVEARDVNVMCRHYPHVPRAVIEDHAWHINNLSPQYRPQLLLAVHGMAGSHDRERVNAFVETFAHQDLANDIDNKMDERSRPAEGRPVRENHVSRHNADAADRHRTIARAMDRAVNDERPSRNYLEAVNDVSDKIEANVHKGHVMKHAEDYRGREVTRKEAIELAYDGHQLRETGAELLDAADVGRIFDDVTGNTPLDVVMGEAIAEQQDAAG